MFRTTTLATLSTLALFGCIATPASAQYLHGNSYGELDYGRTYSNQHHDHGYGHQLDPRHNYHYGHASEFGFGHAAYPTTALSRHHVTPIYTDTTCPYGYDAIGSKLIGCPLQRGQALPGRLTDEYSPGFGLGGPGYNDPHAGDSHSGHSHDGHSHDGHSHEGHSHDRQLPGSNVAPSDRGYLAPPSLPRGSVKDFQPQPDFRREQPQRDDSIRMDTPPPSSFVPSSPAPSSRNNPSQFNTPQSSATERGNSAPSSDGSRRFDTPPPASF